MKPNIVLAGHVCIDHNTTENATYTSWGSSVLYIAQYLQCEQSVEPTIISSYGSDILPLLPDVSFLPGSPNQAKTLLYENDTRRLPRIWKAHHTEFSKPPEITPEIITVLQDADIVIVATLLPNYSPEYVTELFGHTKPGSLKVLCPQGYLRHIAEGGLVVPRAFTEAKELIPLFNLVIYSEEDHPRALELAIEWATLPQTTATIIVTQGERGASYVGSSGEVSHIATQPLAPEEILDSVGCGDVFDAAVASEYYQSRDIAKAITVANLAAGRKLRTAPTLPSAPTV